MGTFSRAWRDFTRYVGMGAERYYLANPGSVGEPDNGLIRKLKRTDLGIFIWCVR